MFRADACNYALGEADSQLTWLLYQSNLIIGEGLRIAFALALVVGSVTAVPVRVVRFRGLLQQKLSVDTYFEKTTHACAAAVSAGGDLFYP